jgi:hypothetical protein
MHALGIPHRCLDRLLSQIHARRLAALLATVVSCVGGPRLSLTDLEPRFCGAARLRHRIERADRLLWKPPSGAGDTLDLRGLVSGDTQEAADNGRQASHARRSGLSVSAPFVWVPQ